MAERRSHEAAGGGGGNDPLRALGAYVPRFVVSRFLDEGRAPTEPAVEVLPACVMLADVCGFTTVVEELAREGERGAERTQELLLGCFGPLVERIERWGGEVLKFPGDAALALFTDGDSRSASLRAVHCALEVQEAAVRPTTSDGLRLRLRVALGAGRVQAARVGGVGGRWELLVRGKPVEQLGPAAASARPGDVVLSPEAAATLGPDVKGSRRGGCLRVESVARAAAPPSPAPEIAPSVSEGALRAYVPRAVQARLDAGQRDWLAEFRRVSVVFVNLGGLDEADERIDRLQEGVRIVQEVVRRFGGSVNQLAADEKGTTFVLAWGLALHAHEDDAARAVLAAMDVHARLTERDIDATIGITTARVFTGRRGSSSRREYALIGDAVNLASRLMQAADTVLCDAPTRSASRQRVVFESLPPMSVKGRTTQASVYRPLTAKQPEEAGARVLIGRARERDLLRSALAALNRSGDGRLIFVEGEPGIGKSHLVRDLLEQGQGLAVSCLLGAADPIEHATPYQAWRPVLASLLGPGARGSAEALAERLAELLGHEPGDVARASLLNPMLPVPLAETEATSRMAPQGRARAVRDLVVRILRRSAERAPIALVLEDGHWFDSSSWELAEAVQRGVDSLLLVISTRPLGKDLEPRAAALRERGERLALGPLETSEASALVCRTLDVDAIPEDVAHFVQERAGGHPLFTEQLACSLRDRGFLVTADGECRITVSAAELASLGLPEVIQGVITTRVDGLTPQQQLTLKVASAVGFRFELPMLREVHPIPEDRDDLDVQLEEMVRLGLVQTEGGASDAFAFKHATIQDTVYGLLTHDQRHRLHRGIAEWLERRHAGALDAVHARLAHHWKAAELHGKAMVHLAAAGERALCRDHAPREAAHFFEELLSLDAQSADQDAGPSVRLPNGTCVTPRSVRRARWERQLGQALTRLGNHLDGPLRSQRALALLGERLPGSAPAVAFSLAVELARRIARRRPRPERWRRCPEAVAPALHEAVRAYEHFASSAYHRTGHVILGMLAVTRAVRLGERAGPSRELAMAQSVFASVAALVRQDRLALAYAESGLRMAREFDDPAVLAYVLSRSSLPGMVAGDWSVVDALDEAIELSRQAGDLYQWEESSCLRANVDLLRGELEPCRRRFAGVAERARESGALTHELWGTWGQAESARRMGELDRAMQLAREALGLAHGGAIANATAPFEANGILASAALRADGAEAARPYAERALAALSSTASVSFTAPSGYVGIVETAAALSDRGEPGALGVKTLRRVCRSFRLIARVRPVFRAAALRCEGERARLLGETGRAMRLWRESLEAAEALGLPHDAALAHLAMGRHSEAGEAERREHVAAAMAGFDSHGAAWELERCRELARA